MHKITPFLWFDDKAEEAVRLYTSVFKNSKIGATANYEENGAKASGRPVGSVMTVEFEIEGQKFMALNGGPIFKFNPSISFFVNCADEKEVEELYSKLSPGGQDLMPLGTYPWSSKYAWISDKYGVSWQLFVAKEASVQKIMPCLMFIGKNHGKAEEAMKLYTSLFPKSEIKFTARYEEKEPFPGLIKHAQFSLVGQDFVAMDAGLEHAFNFNEAVSFVVACKDQEEIDKYWNALTKEGGAEVQCGWLADKYGVSWQIIPVNMDEMLKKPSAMAAMFQMKKIIIKDLK